MSGDFWTWAPAASVIAAWCVFALIFLLRKKPKGGGSAVRYDPAARRGMILQAISYAMVWYSRTRRGGSHPIFPMPLAGQILVALLTAAIAAISVWLVLVAVRTLGRQWAVQAQIVEGHRLVLEGPYRWVRNPIYTGMFGMLVATGLAFATWQMLLAAVVVHLVGFFLRVRVEEKLLLAQFGQEFEEYKRRVPVLLPRL
jgi:protein-S-isoprenylcysteine O-methyltransferase Ste14